MTHFIMVWGETLFGFVIGIGIGFMWGTTVATNKAIKIIEKHSNNK